MAASERWRINRSVALSAVITLALGLISLIVFLVQLDGQVAVNRSWIVEAKPIVQSVPVISTKLDNISATLQEIKTEMRQINRRNP